MPTLSRFLLSLLAIAVLGYVAVFLLANFVTPTQREITVRVSTERLQRE
ncbi:MAG: histidine kinase [Rhizobiales bacterium]|nr:histidine kinase [Hyphomicrobiales bacterium]